MGLAVQLWEQDNVVIRSMKNFSRLKAYRTIRGSKYLVIYPFQSMGGIHRGYFKIHPNPAEEGSLLIEGEVAKYDSMNEADDFFHNINLKKYPDQDKIEFRHYLPYADRTESRRYVIWDKNSADEE